VGGSYRQHASRRSPNRQPKGCMFQVSVLARVKLASRVDATCEIGRGETVRGSSLVLHPEGLPESRARISARVFSLAVHDDRRLGVSIPSSSPSLGKASLALQVKTACFPLSQERPRKQDELPAEVESAGGACKATRDVRRGCVVMKALPAGKARRVGRSQVVRNSRNRASDSSRLHLKGCSTSESRAPTSRTVRRSGSR
jgi:hypothetical protein